MKEKDTFKEFQDQVFNNLRDMEWLSEEAQSEKEIEANVQSVELAAQSVGLSRDDLDLFVKAFGALKTLEILSAITKEKREKPDSDFSEFFESLKWLILKKRKRNQTEAI